MLGRTVEEEIGVELAHGFCGDSVHALGCIGIEERGLEDAIYRLKYSNDSHAFKAAVGAVYELAKARGLRHRWRIRDYRDMACEILTYWISDICPICTGIGREKALDAPVLQDFCKACNGSGRRPYPWHNSESGRHYTETLWMLQQSERRIRVKMVNKTAHEIRDSGLLRFGLTSMPSPCINLQ